ncbi:MULTISPECIES: sugar phosphate isomerase/epimerase family protein [Rhodococcus]|uniref:Sugar phosphate isomerase/epimerase n=1 Tax=Nocardia globerula TaxID=1818 RepID=A0A652YI36_NOCGL|nr:TIM barrel protein [Rhodococcus globerulus]NMD64400.1 sugar phosphate isomerase/epimerase [Nocardia globerula]PVX63430.1 sugar phosphate isomerase/epimerase [Rhodococcus globerulus]QXW05197.1 sugar phosphate isomerase/epimerase [Rhodococcus globerulus]
MTEIGIEYQTVLGLPPVDFVHLAADLGCHHISMKVAGGGGPYNPYGHPTYSMLDDVALRRRFIAAMQDRDVSISLGEGFVVQPFHDLRDEDANLDVMAELGVTRVNAVTMDPDLPRSFDQLATFVEMAAGRGMTTTMEFAKSLTVPDLPTALQAVGHVGRPDFSLLVDTMHSSRSGHGAEDLIMLDHEYVGYIQLSDNTLAQRNPVYRDDSIDRCVPGQGELPVVEIVAALPPVPVIGVEAPMRSLAVAGTSAQECARLAVIGARNVLHAADEIRRVRALGCHT